MSKVGLFCLILFFSSDIKGGSFALATDNIPVQQEKENRHSTTKAAIFLDASKIQLKEHPLPKRHNECSFCHIKKDRFFAKKSTALKLEHEGISHKHGKREMSCHMCHDINNHNYLIQTKGLQASFSNPSPVCARCHQERFRDWKRGLHGKRSGGWLVQTKTQFNCIDCHQPHSVKFPTMQTIEDPIRSPYVIPKPEHHGNSDNSLMESESH